MEKKKRFVSKIGDIFCVEIGNEYKCYFQYVANDITELNSSVIRVFSKRYPFDGKVDMEEVVKGDVSFYAHTILKAGYLYNAWYKVGKSKNIGDVTNIMFRFYSDVNWVARGMTTSSNWSVWKINEKHTFIGEMNEEYRKYHIGLVLSFLNIVHKIKTGSFLSKFLE